MLTGDCALTAYSYLQIAHINLAIFKAAGQKQNEK